MNGNLFVTLNTGGQVKRFFLLIFFILIIKLFSVDNPEIFSAEAVSMKRIDLSWILNENNDKVLLVWNTSETFGIPEESTEYFADNILPNGGGTVIYYGLNSSYSHIGLEHNTVYYYKIWSFDGNEYSSGIVTSETTFSGLAENPVPENYSLDYEISARTLSWSDVTDAANYFISIGSFSGGADIVDNYFCASNSFRFNQNWEYGEKYFWAVTTVYTTREEIIGDEWSFSTECSELQPITLPFTEDWESYSGYSVNNGIINCENTYNWKFVTENNVGRASWGTNAFVAKSGNGALSMDVFSSGLNTLNEAILTINLSDYSASTNLELSFYWVDHGDEEDVGDKIWLRGVEFGD
jgi:hypothetical protein